MIVSVGSDHAGFQLKVKMLPILKQWGVRSAGQRLL